MSGVLTQTVNEVAEQTPSAGEAIFFWVAAILSVAAALGLVLSRKAVHGALFVAVVMICLAGLYVAQDAPFLGVVQVVVYTGAVMMLFLFVIMLVGVDASDSLVETLRAQRWPAVLAGAGLALLLGTAVSRVVLDEPAGLAQAAPDGNVYGLADLLFGRYVLAFEATAALLITAAVGATLLSHRERLVKRPTQRELSEARFRPADGDFSGAGPLPTPGVLARHNSVDTPALLPDGSPSRLSLSRVLVAREEVDGTERAEAATGRDADDPAAAEEQDQAEDSHPIVGGGETDEGGEGRR